MKTKRFREKLVNGKEKDLMNLLIFNEYEIFSYLYLNDETWILQFLLFFTENRGEFLVSLGGVYLRSLPDILWHFYML